MSGRNLYMFTFETLEFDPLSFLLDSSMDILGFNLLANNYEPLEILLFI
ncbi:hypothetical protein [Bacillus sp. Marseille-P3661]|nr:hypothetical protein [Bacillus sp. Marseille-P3661]